ncbi:hypothetical protein [Leifsonia sp. EB34]|uniref:hypothetical protein n=1 Tax=Leifsonia sp. EB34 TaxID=3156303 RepID=UPI0035163598
MRESHPELAVEGIRLWQNPISGLQVESEHALVLVVDARRLTGWKRTWLGSVSHGLVLDLAAPTVVVGPQTEMYVAPRQRTRSRSMSLTAAAASAKPAAEAVSAT